MRIAVVRLDGSSQGRLSPDLLPCNIDLLIHFSSPPTSFTTSSPVTNVWIFLGIQRYWSPKIIQKRFRLQYPAQISSHTSGEPAGSNWFHQDMPVAHLREAHSSPRGEKSARRDLFTVPGSLGQPQKSCSSSSGVKMASWEASTMERKPRRTASISRVTPSFKRQRATNCKHTVTE